MPQAMRLLIDRKAIGRVALTMVSLLVVPAKAGTHTPRLHRFNRLTSLEYWITRLRGR